MAMKLLARLESMKKPMELNLATFVAIVLIFKIVLFFISIKPYLVHNKVLP
jgi:hypothetical protein